MFTAIQLERVGSLIFTATFHLSIISTFLPSLYSSFCKNCSLFLHPVVDVAGIVGFALFLSFVCPLIEQFNRNFIIDCKLATGCTMTNPVDIIFAFWKDISTLL